MPCEGDANGNIMTAQSRGDHCNHYSHDTKQTPFQSGTNMHAHSCVRTNSLSPNAETGLSKDKAEAKPAELGTVRISRGIAQLKQFILAGTCRRTAEDV